MSRSGRLHFSGGPGNDLSHREAAEETLRHRLTSVRAQYHTGLHQTGENINLGTQHLNSVLTLCPACVLCSIGMITGIQCSVFFCQSCKNRPEKHFYMPDKRISFGLGPMSDLFLSFLQKYPEHAIYKVLHLMLRRGELQHRMQRKVLYRVK